MPIQSGDVKLLKSANMADVAEGGGAPTGNVIADGVSNSIFPDISELDRAGGRVSLRKTFVSIQTDDQDTYFGGNIIVAEPPADPLVNVAVFTNDSTFDRREDAANRMESYLNAGPEFNGYLYENHITGQRSIQLFQRTTDAPPTIGRTLVIRQDEGLGTEFEQYVRVTRVLVEERTFSFNSGGSVLDYKANVVTCDLSDALRHSFTGSPANRLFAKATGAAKVRDTVVADAGSYYGVVPLTLAANLGDVYANVSSVYTQLVPSAQSENPLVDQRHSAAFANTLAATPRLVSVGGAPLSQRIKVGQENRGYNYVTILAPLPAKGSVRVVYRALGNTYSLSDDGSGNLTGNGSGTVNYLTGSVSVTLQALPDDRSAVVFYWGPNQAFTNRAGHVAYSPPTYRLKLEQCDIVPGTFVLQYESGGILRTITDNGAGQLSDGSGNIAYITGDLYFKPTLMPDAQAQFTIAYDWREVVEEAFTGLTPDASGVVAFTLAQLPAPKSLAILWKTSQVVSNTSGSTAGASSAASGGITEKVVVGTETRYIGPMAPVWALA